MISKVVFYTNHKVVLGYVCNESRRLYIYVANKVQIICKISTPDQWRYEESSNNPPDLATHSLQPRGLAESDWLDGLQFLRNASEIPGPSVKDTTLSADDREVQKEVKSCVTTIMPQESTH